MNSLVNRGDFFSPLAAGVFETGFEGKPARSGSRKVCVVYRSFPLETHAYAAKAARYGLAALRLGTYLGLRGAEPGYFGSVVESGSHQNSLRMILEGLIDAAALDSTVLEAFDRCGREMVRFRKQQDSDARKSSLRQHLEKARRQMDVLF